MEIPPIESFSIEQDITNLELRMNYSIENEEDNGRELMSRFVAILRRLNREKAAMFTFALPPVPQPLTTIPPYVPPNPFPAYPNTNPSIICSGGTANAVESHADATGTSEAFGN